MSRTTATLRFPPGNWTGFTPAGVAGFSDVQPSRIVRELVQNALDAAVEAEEPLAKVCFRVREVKVDDIPGIDQYETELANAIRAQETGSPSGLADHAREVVDRMEDALGWELCRILVVADNGIGLDSSRMKAVLGDGASSKEVHAAGSYGNGHMVSIPASNLRYVLYGGVRDGRKIASGHAYLASSHSTGSLFPTSGTGVYVADFREGSHLYPEGKEVPRLIGRELDWVERNWGHGSAVIVTAFNDFHEETGNDELWKALAKAAAFSFFAAIEAGSLEVSYEEVDPRGGVSRNDVLGKHSLREVLEKHREEAKRKKNTLLSGSRAYEAWTTVREGHKHEVSTSLGRVILYLRESFADGLSRIELCRNGMHIVDQGGIPRFRNQFSDKEPFHAVLTLDAERGRELHRLIRKAEGPLHDKLSLKLLKPAEQRALTGALVEVRSWLRQRLPDVSTESYSPDDFLVVESGEGITGLSKGKSRLSMSGSPEAVRPWTKGTAERIAGSGNEDGPFGGGRGGRRGKGALGGGGEGIDRPSRRILLTRVDGLWGIPP